MLPSTALWPTSRAPTTIAGRFVLLDQIGAGAMGTVWRAWDRRDGRYVAAKVLAPRGATRGSLLLRFVREQSLRIDHPHVLSPTGWAAEDDRAVLVMDLVRGGSLELLVRRCGPLPEPLVAVLLEQLLSALAAVHAAGVVHRDVKPANLLLDATGTGPPHLWLADFGVAALLADEIRFTRVPGGVGTDGYLAPEAVAGAHPDPRHDLYAAGVVARRLLADPGGRGPVGAPAPPALAPLIATLCHHHPAGRPASAEAALVILRRLVDLGADRDARGTPDLRDVLGPPPVPRPTTLDRLGTGCLWSAAGLSGAAGALLVRGLMPGVVPGLVPGLAGR